MAKPAIDTEKEIIVVSGSSGLLGKALINRLGEDYLIIGLDILSQREQYMNIMDFGINT